LTPPEDFTGSFFITVTATTADYGDQAQAAQPVESDPAVITADIQTDTSDAVILSADELLEFAENATQGEIEHVHLIDRSQGEIIDNGDGTWSFVPAEGFDGNADIAYVVNDNGTLIDASTSVSIIAPTSETTQTEVTPPTELTNDATLTFSDEDMLAQVTELQGDDLSVESVEILSGEGLLTTDGQGQHSYTPAEGYVGDVSIGFVATDGQESVANNFTINVSEDDPQLAFSDDGSITLSSGEVVDALGLAVGSEITMLEYSADEGTIIDNGDASWTFWPDDTFSGSLPLSAEALTNGETAQYDLTLQVEMETTAEAIDTATTSADDTAAQSTTTEEVVVEAAAETAAEDEIDVTVAPGGTTGVAIPDEVSGNLSVEEIEVSGLPEGATVENGLPTDDGNFIVTGDLTQPISISFGDTFEGTSSINFQGLDSLGNNVPDAQASVTVEVDDQYAMQSGGGASSTDVVIDTAADATDWTSSDQSNVGVDVMDDSSSFDNADSTSTDSGFGPLDDNL
jgi:hypothetical protein